MLKYYQYILALKKLMHKRYDVEIIKNKHNTSDENFIFFILIPSFTPHKLHL